MEHNWHEVVIQNDEADKAFVTAAPLLVKALRLIASVRALPLSLNVAWRESELAGVGDPHLVHRRALKEARELLGTLKPQLESVYKSLSHLQIAKADSRHSHSLLHCHEGLIAPREMAMDAFLESQPVFDYANFRAQFEQLCQVMANSVLFSACDPRIKVLQSRYRLYRAFNGVREDDFHPTLGGGSFNLAPKLDVRRVESCMSANTLVTFMRQTLAQEPDMVLPAQGEASFSMAGVPRLRVEREGPQSAPSATASHSNEELDERDPTLKEVVDIFFGPLLPPEERYFTADGLGLLPNYAETTGRNLDGFETQNATLSTKAHAMPLLKHFLDVFAGNNGDLLARLVLPMLSKIVTGENAVLELEFTATGRVAGEVQHIASWCVRSGLSATGKVQLALRIVQQPLCAGETGGTSKNMEEVLRNIFGPIWMALLQPHEHSEMVQFLQQLASVEVGVSGNADLQELPVVNDLRRYSVESGITPPDAFFIYHVWRNVQLLNCVAVAHRFFASDKREVETRAARATTAEGDNVTSEYFLPERSLFLQHRPIFSRPLLFRLGASATSKNSFMESVMGLLIADEMMHPVEVFNWSPLAYLYYLTQRRIVVTPSRNYITPSGSALERDVRFIVETGLNGAIVTLDPLHYSTSDNALCEEFNGLQRGCHLALAEITELCLHSAEHANWSMEKRCEMLGGPWERVRARYNEFTKTQVNSLRLHFRESSLAHEMDLLCRKGLTAESGFIVACGEEKEGQTAALFGPKTMGTASHYAAALSPTSLTLAAQRETLWRFFKVPRHSPLAKVDVSNTWWNFVERQIEYPRIVISGPKSMEKSHGAVALSKSFLRRQYYRSFNVDFEPPPTGQFQTATTVNALLAVLGGNTASKEEQRVQREARSSSDVFSPPLKREAHVSVPEKFTTRGGVWDVVLTADVNDATKAYFRPLPTWSEFQSDVRQLRRVSHKSFMQRYAAKRLGMLECKFNLHVALTNDDQEQHTRYTPPLLEKADLYKCVKVDVHCHMAAGMTAKELLSFIKKKVKKHADDIVDVEPGTGRFVTLGEFFAKLRTSQMQGAAVNVEDLTVALLKVKAGKDTFNRFDEFNGRYSPLGNSALRTLFLKTDNYMGGRYFAELIRQTFHRQAEDGHTFSEYRLSIYGRHRSEWDQLARWILLHHLLHPTNRWMVQIPRLYSIYRRNGIIASFGEMLTNLFAPLWEASVNPEAHPFLSYLLSQVSGFDSVDNESEREPDTLVDTPPPQWTFHENPPFAYWMYYMWVNITALNRYRAARGLSTFSFRPHAGESGDPDHMADAFFVADGVNHGINLKHSPVLQYLYYLAQIPLGMTPLSNNALFCKYNDNPFPVFFRRGLNVALASDGALIFHHTEQPLIEEYSTAANFWNLSMVDVCEIAKNSVLMSGFPSYRKKAWLGNLCALRSAAGNDVRLSKVPQSRCTFRYEVYIEELAYLHRRAALHVPLKSIMDAQLEGLYTLDVVGLTREEVIERRLHDKPVAVGTGADADELKGDDAKAAVARVIPCVTAQSLL
ncbi:putative AMP deaminase [Trypanosoma conorhini]|uniref:Putative AMP deaminase n=1 Tax=Trypanosoma conorhini TaxID=83891 RepID=A0A3R7L9F8_9TRYP|nr:putative AMP deaminase [Trypanosoma conorhini]RNF22559.1 putative AMP deaminase [Trypanosoma conorhini]